MPIITSMLDTDFYKFTMQQAVFKKFPDVEVEYTFKNRTKDVWLSGAIYWDKINKEIDHMATLRFTQGELDYLKSLGLFSRGYLEYLRQFRFNPDSIIPTGNSDGVDFTIAGTWLNTILWEVPLLAIVSELYSGTCKADPYVTSAKNLYDKIYSMHLSNTLHFADFGTRRRYSRDWQDTVVKKLASKDPFTGFVGTSNVLFAKKHNVRPIGTMAHEFIQAMQAMVRLSDSQKYAFQTWADIYRGDLGIALSDTLGMDAFFNDFDMYFAKLFDGARHDSGNPDVWCNKLIAHYRAMGIDPMTKTAVFSDGLTFPEMIRLHKNFSETINVSFGIGTNLTNDCGITPLQIVIKMSQCDGKSVAKISDSPGKQMCNDREYLKYLASVFNIPKKWIGGEK